MSFLHSPFRLVGLNGSSGRLHGFELGMRRGMKLRYVRVRNKRKALRVILELFVYVFNVQSYTCLF